MEDKRPIRPPRDEDNTLLWFSLAPKPKLSALSTTPLLCASPGTDRHAILCTYERTPPRTLDSLAAKMVFYYSLAFEVSGRLPEARPRLLGLHRTCCLRFVGLFFLCASEHCCEHGLSHVEVVCFKWCQRRMLQDFLFVFTAVFAGCFLCGGGQQWPLEYCFARFLELSSRTSRAVSSK